MTVRDASSCCLVLLLCGLLPATDSSAGVENPARVQTAVQEYLAAMEVKDRNQRIQQFARAEQLFRQIITGDDQHEPVANADLYTNLGNAALQAEHLGAAIVAYRHALRLDPQHAQARQNLAYSRSLVPEWIRHEESHRLLDTLFFWSTSVPRSQVLLVGSLCFLIASILFAVGHVRNQPVLRNSALVPLFAWLAATSSLLVNRGNDTAADVVVVSEAPLHTADSENSPPRLARPLPSGAEIGFVQQRGRWSEVRLPDGRTGWVRSSAIERVSA